MSYFAKIDISRQVLSVIVADQGFIDQQPGTWVLADLDGVNPKNYPGIGYTYDPDLVAFIAPKPFPSWSLDESCKWQAPSAMPNDGQMYAWDEESLSWIAR